MTNVFCTTRFEGFHRWPDAPPEVAFLAVRHRHVFHVRVEVAVEHNDRDVEFIMLKRAVEQWIETRRLTDAVANWSCERWADELLQAFDAERVEVSEDGENGAIVTR